MVRRIESAIELSDSENEINEEQVYDNVHPGVIYNSASLKI